LKVLNGAERGKEIQYKFQALQEIRVLRPLVQKTVVGRSGGQPKLGKGGGAAC